MKDDISIYFKYLYVRLLLIAVFSFLSKSSRMFRVLSTYRTLTFPDFGPSGSPSLTSSSLIFADFFFPMLFFVIFSIKWLLITAFYFYYFKLYDNCFAIQSAIFGLKILQRNIWFSMMQAIYPLSFFLSHITLFM